MILFHIAKDSLVPLGGARLSFGDIAGYSIGVGNFMIFSLAGFYMPADFCHCDPSFFFLLNSDTTRESPFWCPSTFADVCTSDPRTSLAQVYNHFDHHDP